MLLAVFLGENFSEKISDNHRARHEVLTRKNDDDQHFNYRRLY